MYVIIKIKPQFLPHFHNFYTIFCSKTSVIINILSVKPHFFTTIFKNKKKNIIFLERERRDFVKNKKIKTRTIKTYLHSKKNKYF